MARPRRGPTLAAPRSGSEGRHEADPPLVSVIMAVRNEASTLPAALAALAASTYPPHRLEVVVADGGSTDGTREWLDGHAVAEERLRVIDNPAKTTPGGLNAALAEARGEVILRLDGHTVPAPDYVAACVRSLAELGADAVGGCIDPRGATPFGVAVAEAMASAFGGGPAAFRQGGEGPTDTVYLGAWRRSVLEELGGFDVDLARNQDYELCLRIRQRGGTVWLAPDIKSTTVVRDSPRALARQYIGYGAGRAATWVRHPGSLKVRQAVPASFSAAVLAAVVATPFSAWGRGALAVLLAAYVAAAGAASVARVGIRRPGRTLRVAGAFAIMHLAWGAGFWGGLPGAVARRRGGRE